MPLQNNVYKVSGTYRNNNILVSRHVDARSLKSTAGGFSRQVPQWDKATATIPEKRANSVMPSYVCELAPAPFLLFWFAVEPLEVPVTLAVLVAELPEEVVTPKLARLMPLEMEEVV